jgi:hypothetical protein
MSYHVMVLRNEVRARYRKQPPAWHRERQLPARRPSYQHNGSAASLPEQSSRASNRNEEEPK